MQVILLEPIAKLGAFGDTVKVRPGYGRNYLIPQGKALSATASNLQYFEEKRGEIQQRREQLRQASLGRAEKIEKTLLRSEVNASEDGKLYGSVTVRDIAAMFVDRGIEVEKKEITMPEDHIRQVGQYTIVVTLEGEKVVEVPLEVVAAPKHTE